MPADSEVSARNAASALARWAVLPPAERSRRTRPGREAFLASLDAQIPPEVSDPADRAERVTALLKAHYLKMQANSMKARRLKREADARKAADEILDATGLADCGEQ
jgi:hypothetical protein